MQCCAPSLLDDCEDSTRSREPGVWKTSILVPGDVTAERVTGLNGAWVSGLVLIDKCDNSNESYRAALSYGTAYHLVQGGSYILVFTFWCTTIQIKATFKWKGVSF